MLNAFAITKMLLDDEQPVDPAATPVDPDPEKLLTQYVSGKVPFMLPGSPVFLWQRWGERLNGRQSKRVQGTETKLVQVDAEHIALQYHNTYVVTVDNTNKVTVATDGFCSKTTMERINWAAPGGWHVFGRKPRKEHAYNWNLFWCNYGSKSGAWGDQRVLPFTDGDTILANGTLVMQAQPVYPTKRRKRANPDDLPA